MRIIHHNGMKKAQEVDLVHSYYIIITSHIVLLFLHRLVACSEGDMV